MCKGYAYQFSDFNALKEITTKNKETYILKTKPKLVGELNPNSMKSFAQLQHKFPNPTTTHTNPP